MQPGRFADSFECQAGEQSVDSSHFFSVTACHELHRLKRLLVTYRPLRPIAPCERQSFAENSPGWKNSRNCFWIRSATQRFQAWQPLRMVIRPFASSKPADVPPQPSDYRKAAKTEHRGETMSRKLSRSEAANKLGQAKAGLGTLSRLPAARLLVKLRAKCCSAARTIRARRVDRRSMPVISGKRPREISS